MSQHFAYGGLECHSGGTDGRLVDLLEESDQMAAGDPQFERGAASVQRPEIIGRRN